jgi:thymidylate synthase
MSVYLNASNSADAWLKIMDYLIGETKDGKCFNLITTISDPTHEDKEVTRIVDLLARETKSKSPMENANSIWPHVLAPPDQSLETTMAKMTKLAAPTLKEANPRHSDSYIERLVAWRSKDGGERVPQLENIINRMRTEITNSAPKSSSYELSVFSPGLDAGYMSFPCLSHLSFKLDSELGRIHLAAIYRNHHFVNHGYGNFLGLGRLMKFVARQVGCEVGELLSVSTHADAECSRGKTRIRARLEEIRSILNSNGVRQSAPKKAAVSAT